MGPSPTEILRLTFILGSKFNLDSEKLSGWVFYRLHISETQIDKI